MRDHAPRPVVLAAMLFLPLLAACAASQLPSDPTVASPSFWIGFWHGFIAPVAFVIGLFSDAVRIYAFPNSGLWYDFGFMLGISGFSGGVFAGSRSNSAVRGACESADGSNPKTTRAPAGEIVAGPTRSAKGAVLTVLLLIAAAGLGFGSRPAGSEEAVMQTQIEIPQSLREEHAEIHEALIAATTLPGPVGQAATELARILHPHFVREEEVALPPLGLLQPLAGGRTEPWMTEVLPMTDALAAELSQMLLEHEAIGAAATALERVARAEGAYGVEGLARKLRLHARSEEEVFYPAAILVGQVLRMRGVGTSRWVRALAEAGAVR